MRYITLKEEEVEELNRLHKTSINWVIRMRSQCLLLSHSRLQVKEISKILGVRSRAIREWFDSWESLSYSGLKVQPGRGAKKKLKDVPVDAVKELVASNARNLNTVLAELQARYHVEVSKITLQRFLKNMGI
jgi:transposase